MAALDNLKNKKRKLDFEPPLTSAAGSATILFIDNDSETKQVNLIAEYTCCCLNTTANHSVLSKKQNQTNIISPHEMKHCTIKMYNNETHPFFHEIVFGKNQQRAYSENVIRIADVRYSYDVSNFLVSVSEPLVSPPICNIVSLTTHTSSMFIEKCINCVYGFFNKLIQNNLMFTMFKHKDFARYFNRNIAIILSNGDVTFLEKYNLSIFSNPKKNILIVEKQLKNILIDFLYSSISNKSLNLIHCKQPTKKCHLNKYKPRFSNLNYLFIHTLFCDNKLNNVLNLNELETFYHLFSEYVLSAGGSENTNNDFNNYNGDDPKKHHLE